MINTDSQLIYADLTYKIRGALFAVYNELGYGHKENVYQKALELEFQSQHIPFTKETHVPVQYKTETVGSYRPDFIIDKKIIIELKAVEFLPKTFEAQVIHYLKTTNYHLGLLVNFGGPKLYIKRLIWTKNPRQSVENQ